MHLLRFFFLLLLILVASCTGRRQRADLVVLGGPIYTMDDRQPIVQSVAVTGDKNQPLAASRDLEALQVRLREANRRSTDEAAR